MTSRDIKKTFEMITNRHHPLSEIITKEDFLKCLNKKHCRSVWGVSVGKILHLGYDSLITKQWNMLRAGFDHTVLIADTHTMIQKQDITDLEIKSEYTHAYFKDICKLHGAKFVLGSSFQYSKDYTSLLYKLLSVAKTSSIKKVSATAHNQELGSMVLPVMQIADSVYLKSDIVYGGVDQRGSYVFGREVLSQANFTKPTVLLSPLSLDIKGNTLASSSMSTRITIHDDDKTLRNKINKMFAPPSAERNPLLDLFKYSILPWFNKVYVSTLNGTVVIKDYEQFQRLYLGGNIDVREVKDTAFEYLSSRLNGIQRYFQKRSYLTDWIDMERIN